jgi:hypothetical protein
MTDDLTRLLQKLSFNRDEAITMIAALAKGIDVPADDTNVPTREDVEQIIVSSFDLLTAESIDLRKLREATRETFIAYTRLGRTAEHDVEGAMMDHLAITTFELATNFLASAPLFELADGRGDALTGTVEPSIYDMNARIPGCWVQV